MRHNRILNAAAVLFAAEALLFCCMTGCRGVNGDEFISVVEHDAPYAYHPEVTQPAPETEPPIPTASDYYQMRTILQEFVTSGVEHGQIILTDYEGDPETDLKTVTRFLTNQDPVSSYAVDYLVCGRKPYGTGWLITADVIYRRSVSEIQSIVPVRGNEAAFSKLREALTQQKGSVTLQVSGYTEIDFADRLYGYCLQHPDEIPQSPRISVAAYPASGNVRVLEVHFVYDSDRETLKTIRSEADAVLSSAYNYIRYARTDREKLDLLFSYLTSRFPYTEWEEASVYTLLCRGVSNSQSVASAVNYLCNKAGLESTLVLGTRDELPYAWNVILADGEYRHYDFHACALAGERPAGKLDEEMDGCEWDRESVPACEIRPEEPEPSASSEPETEPVPSTAEAPS